MEHVLAPRSVFGPDVDPAKHAYAPAETDDPIARMTAVQLAAALHRRDLSATEALEAILARAERVVPALNPFSVPLYDRARRAAKRADELFANGLAGPLTGIPITVKDSQWLAGVESAHGSLTMRGHIPTETAVALERLEAAGAVIFAKTAVPEFCYSGITESPVHGRTSNPWNLNRTPGGSSGGAAAAVATGLGPLSLGGDGGGSIRIPAAFTGVCGFKPTFGAVPREPCAEAWRTLVAIGPLARSVADARLMLQTVAGADPRDRYSVDVLDLDEPAPEPTRIRAVTSEDLRFAAVDEDVRRAFRAAVERVEAAGFDVVEDNPGLESSVRTWATIAGVEARREKNEAYERQRELLTERAAHFLEFGGRLTDEDYQAALADRHRIHAAYVDLYERTGASVLLTPTLGCEAFPHGTTYPTVIGDEPINPHWQDWAPFLYDANLCGFPAASLPIGFGDDGLPVGLQVQGLRGSDGWVLAVSETIEREVGWHSWPPEPRVGWTPLARG